MQIGSKFCEFNVLTWPDSQHNKPTRAQQQGAQLLKLLILSQTQ